MKKPKPAFHDLGFTKSQALTLSFKAEIHLRILDEVKRRKIPARELETILGVPQPRVSELMNGKISSVSIEKLLNYLEKLGLTATVSFHQLKAG